jgi:uncharacterized protein (DUF433 family)
MECRAYGVAIDLPLAGALVTWRWIDTTPGVCGGEPCIVRTTIPVWLLVEARRLGTSEADLLRSYPILRAEDSANAWAYSRAHKEEIEEQIRVNRPPR